MAATPDGHVPVATQLGAATHGVVIGPPKLPGAPADTTALPSASTVVPLKSALGPARHTMPPRSAMRMLGCKRIACQLMPRQAAVCHKSSSTTSVIASGGAEALGATDADNASGVPVTTAVEVADGNRVVTGDIDSDFDIVRVAVPVFVSELDEVDVLVADEEDVAVEEPVCELDGVADCGGDCEVDADGNTEAAGDVDGALEGDTDGDDAGETDGDGDPDTVGVGVMLKPDVGDCDNDAVTDGDTDVDCEVLCGK